MAESIIAQKSFAFAKRIVNLRKYLITKDGLREFDLSHQLLRSGTSIGANIEEAQRAQSTADFISKLSISLKEACESYYWLRLLTETEYLTAEESDSIINECREIIRLLTSIIKTTKDNNLKSE